MRPPAVLSYAHVRAGRAAGWQLAAVVAAGLLGVLPGSPLRAKDAAEAKTPPRLTAQEWREDLRLLATQARAKHKALFHTMTETEFTAAVDKLDADIPTLDDDQILVRMAQLMALIQDGHSGLSLRPAPPKPDLKDHIPVRFDRFSDGIYVRAADPEYAGAVGGKVVAVGGVPWEEAMRRVDSIQSHDPGNDGERLAWSAKVDLGAPRLLHGLGLSPSGERADFLIEKGGVTTTVTMKASVPLGPWYLNALPEGWVDARPASAPVPLSIRHEDKPYWFTAVPEHRAVYFQFNIVMNGEGETLADFSRRLAAALEQPGVERLVIDLRNNTGGDNTLLRPLLVALIRSSVNRPGGIFALIGPTTFSAAQNFVNRLGNYADVVFVGRPTGENVNFYGDAAGITLPHSRLEAGVSRLWWQDEDPRDTRTATFPEVAVEPSFKDYLAGADPALDVALTAPKPETLGEALEGSVAGGQDALAARYKAFVGDPRHRYLPDSEREVNALGYRLLGQKRIPEAIFVFQLNVALHPNSWNAYDSLGEAYANARDKERALQAYRKSIELNPDNTGGKRMIEKIEGAK